MSNVLTTVALVGAAYWAWQQGYFDGQGAGDNVPATQDVLDDFLPVSVPVGEPTGGPKSKEELLLEKHYLYVSDFSQKHMKLTAAIMIQESGGKAHAVSYQNAVGLMQVLVPTAKMMHDNGYNQLDPTKATLLTPQGSIYFGTSYLDYLSKHRLNTSWEWLIRAYHGGEGNAGKYMRNNKLGPKNTKYYKSVFAIWQRLKNQGSMA